MAAYIIQPLKLVLIVGILSPSAFGAIEDRHSDKSRSSRANRTFYIEDRDELTKALSLAQGGDRILLARGHYGTLRLVKVVFDAEVLIASASTDDPAVFTDLSMADSRNISIRSVRFQRPLAKHEPTWTYVNRLERNANIRLSNIEFSGSPDANASNDGNLVFIRDAVGLIVESSEFRQANSSLIIQRSSDIQIKNNIFSEQKLDAMAFSSVQDVSIRGNFVTAHFPTGPKDHPDAIQFWTAGTTAVSERITIEDNIIWQGRGNGSQGIFFKDEVGTLPFRHVRIRNNLIFIRTPYWHGISIEGGTDVLIERNTSISPPGAAAKNRIVLKRVAGARVIKNAADQIVLIDSFNVKEESNLDLSRKMSSSLTAGLRKTSISIDDLTLKEFGFTPTYQMRQQWTAFEQPTKL